MLTYYLFSLQCCCKWLAFLFQWPYLVTTGTRRWQDCGFGKTRPVCPEATEGRLEDLGSLLHFSHDPDLVMLWFVCWHCCLQDRNSTHLWSRELSGTWGSEAEHWEDGLYPDGQGSALPCTQLPPEAEDATSTQDLSKWPGCIWGLRHVQSQTHLYTFLYSFTEITIQLHRNCICKLSLNEIYCSIHFSIKWRCGDHNVLLQMNDVLFLQSEWLCVCVLTLWFMLPHRQDQDMVLDIWGPIMMTTLMEVWLLEWHC